MQECRGIYGSLSLKAPCFRSQMAASGRNHDFGATCHPAIVRGCLRLRRMPNKPFNPLGAQLALRKIDSQPKVPPGLTPASRSLNPTRYIRVSRRPRLSGICVKKVHILRAEPEV